MKHLLLFILAATISSNASVSDKENVTPTRRSEMASTLLDGKIYVAGGINFWGSNNSFEAYDITTDKWEKLPNLPEKLNHSGVASYQDVVYVSGGFYNAIQTKFSDILYAYNVKDRTWTVLTKMPEERAAHVMIQRGDYLHLIGGRNHKDIWSYDLKNKTWTSDKISPLPEKRDHINVLQDDEKLYVVGGRQSGTAKGDCWEYDFSTEAWKIFATLPVPRGGQSACLLNQQIHIVGGEDLNEGTTFSRHDIYDLAEGKWTEGEDLKIARHGLVSELFENKWYIYGGGKKAGIKTLISTTSNLEILDL